MKFYIIGSGGFAKEVLFLYKDVFGTLEEFAGFIDFRPSEPEIVCMDCKFQVLDEETFLLKGDSECNIYLGVGDPQIIRKVSEKFKSYNFPNLIHKSAVIDKSVSLQRGNIITAGCVLTVDIKIGSFNVINLNSTIGHDTVLGDYNVVNPGSNISGSVYIGNSNLFGTNSTVLQGLQIGNNSIIGASSLVTKNVDHNLVVVGVPAKEIKKNL